MKYTAFAVRVSVHKNPTGDAENHFVRDDVQPKRVRFFYGYAAAVRHARVLRKELPTMYVKAVRVAVDVRVVAAPPKPPKPQIAGMGCQCPA